MPYDIKKQLLMIPCLNFDIIVEMLPTTLMEDLFSGKMLKSKY